MTGNKRKQTGMLVQLRDLGFLRLLATLGVVDRDLFMIVAGFHSVTRANTRLLQLVCAGLLRRFFLGLGPGRKAIYSLSPKGAFLAAVPYRGPRRKQEETLIADYYVQHQLAVNRIYAALAHRPIPAPGVNFGRWLAFYESITPARRLIPDGYVELATPTGKLCAFVEVDLGHESLGVWREKALNYREFALSGEFTARFHEERFRVLVLVTSERRLKTIRKTVAAVTEKVFWFAALNAVNNNNLFAPVWYRAGDDQPKPLL
jgi:hypothetical protein